MNLRRHRRAVASLCLGAWLFALGISIAYACGWHGAPNDEGATASAALAAGDRDDMPPPGCDAVCKDDVAVLAKLQAVQEVPGGAGAPALVSALLLPAGAPVISTFDPAVDRLPPAVPVPIRFLRLLL
jgi:hypothetical protein